MSHQNKETIIVFTDGACKGNGKKNAQGGLGVYNQNTKECTSLNIQKILPTFNLAIPSNQKAELLAILQAVKMYCTDNNIVIIFTDSMYSINCLTKWYINWEKNNWLNSSKKEVLNKEIIQEILKYIKRYNIEFKHIKAHTKEPSKDSNKYLEWYGNFMADALASHAIQ